MPSFPRTLNEKAARTVASIVAATAVIALITGQYWLLLVLAYGFIARVIAGPTFSPMAQLSMRVIAPRLGEPKIVAGPPKRFAQAIGAALTVLGAVAWLLGSTAVPVAVLAILAVFATLEGALGLCVGCRIFALSMSVGIIPETVCVECSNIWARPGVSR